MQNREDDYSELLKNPENNNSFNLIWGDEGSVSIK